MDVRELGKRVSHRIVNCALTDFAAFDVRNGDAHRNCGGCGGQHFVAVSYEEKQIGPPRRECIGEAQDCDPDSFGHSCVGIGTEETLDASLNGKAIALNFLNGVSELRRKVRTESENAKFNIGTYRELAQWPVKMAVIGARRSDDANAAPGGN
jgi:hypothetical protein